MPFLSRKKFESLLARCLPDDKPRSEEAIPISLVEGPFKVDTVMITPLRTPIALSDSGRRLHRISGIKRLRMTVPLNTEPIVYPKAVNAMAKVALFHMQCAIIDGNKLFVLSKTYANRNPSPKS